MFIKLQPDQVTLFWDLIKQGLIASYAIPVEHQQGFAISHLESLLSGMSQAWVSYTEDDEGKMAIHFVATSKIVDEKFYGIKTFIAESLYGFRLISDEMLDEMDVSMVKFAKANGCNVVAVSYTIKRMESILKYLGFENHATTVRKFI